MTCYFRHLSGVFAKAGITVTAENRKQLDALIRGVVGTTGKDCPATWREVKKLVSQDEDGFILALQKAWRNMP